MEYVQYSPRGRFSIQGGASDKEALTLDPVVIENSDLSGLKSLISRKGMYQIRARSDPSDASSPYVITSIPVVHNPLSYPILIPPYPRASNPAVHHAKVRFPRRDPRAHVRRRQTHVHGVPFAYRGPRETL